MIEQAYLEGEALGLAIWGEDEAGPYQTRPYAGHRWSPEGHPGHYPHEYRRGGTAKIMTLFHPQSGQVCVKGTSSTTNAILHPWLKDELETILAQLPKKKRWLTRLKIARNGNTGKSDSRPKSPCLKNCHACVCC